MSEVEPKLSGEDIQSQIARRQARLGVLSAYQLVQLSGDKPDLTTARRFYLDNAEVILTANSVSPEIARRRARNLFWKDSALARRASCGDPLILNENITTLADLIEEEQSRVLDLQFSLIAPEIS